MRSVIDNKFSNLIKSNQSLKLSKNPLVKLKVSIDFEPNQKIEAAYVQYRLSEFQKLQLTKEELAWLQTTKMFDKSFLNWFKTWTLPNFNLTEEENKISVEIEVPYAEAILAEKILEACLSEARFSFYLSSTNEEEGRFYAFGSDRYNIKTSSFLNSPNIYIIEDAVGLRPNPDWYSLVGIFLSAAPFNFVGTTNSFHAMTLSQSIVTYCDEVRWLEDWPDSNFSPSEETFDDKKYRGFLLPDSNPATAVEMRGKHPKAILVSPETSAFEMAHTTAHVGNVIFNWSQQLVQDLNIDYYKPVISWQEQCKILNDV